MAAETEQPKEPIRAPETPAPAGAAGGGGMSPMVFFIAMGLSWVVMLGGGFALVQFVLPAKLASAIKPPASATEEGDNKDKGADGKKTAEGKAKSEEKGEAKSEEKSKDKGKEKSKADAKTEGKKEEKGHGETAKKEGAEATKVEGEGASGGAEKVKSKEFVLSEIIVNIAGSRGARYIKVSVYFDASADVLEELETQRARVIDLVSSAIGSKTMDELTSPNARGNLREELIATCNGLLKKGQINNLYFVDFLIQ